MVQIEMMAKAAANFGLIGYWGPKKEPMPIVGPITVSADVPATQVSVI